MKLFNNYLDGISNIVSENKIPNSATFSNESILPQYFDKAIVNKNQGLQSENATNKVLIEFNKSQLITLFGPNPYSFNRTTIGSHPDFEGLSYREFEKHYCVSMFMDIKGSTRLIEKYNLLQIRKIKDTVLTLAIHVASHFGGHVHRLQGDGIFLQFVRRNQKEQDAVINALNASSILCHFISSDLAQIFSINGVHPLRVRIGIDLGYKEDVIWSHYGIPGCSELTTTSLHTDLAAKLQGDAKSNGIMVGENIQEILDIKNDFCQTCYDQTGKLDYYIYQGFKNYKKYEFNWQNYLNSFDFVKRTQNSIEIEEQKLKLICKISKPNSDSKFDYYQNSFAIEKGSKIEYQIVENGHLYYKKDWETIEWKAVNSGKEAKLANALEHDFGKKNNDKIICETYASYVGHHYVECIIKRLHSDNLKLKFSIFIK